MRRLNVDCFQLAAEGKGEAEIRERATGVVILFAVGYEVSPQPGEPRFNPARVENKRTTYPALPA